MDQTIDKGRRNLQWRPHIHVHVYQNIQRIKLHAHTNLLTGVHRRARHLPNSFLTLAAPTPTNISSNSDPEAKKNGTSASPAMALASNVLPVPGGPINSRPDYEWY